MWLANEKFLRLGSVGVQSVLSKDFYRASINTSDPVHDRRQ